MNDYKELIERLAQCATDCHELLLEAADAIEELSAERDGKKSFGEWKMIWKEEKPYTNDVKKCSVCGRISGKPFGRYCKWCGAFMNGNTTPPKEKK